MKMKYVSSFVSLLILVCSTVFAAPPEVVTEEPDWQPPPESTPEVARQALLRDLRRKAVLQWLRNAYDDKEKIASIESQLTPEVVENNILSYSPGRSADNKTTLSVEINHSALRGWVNLIGSKSKEGSTVRPAIIVASQLPGFLLSAEETSSRAKDTPFVQTMIQMTHSSLAKMGVNASAPKGAIYGNRRPRNESEIRSLGNQSALSSFNSAIWVNLSACRECGGARLDACFYNFIQRRNEGCVSQDLTADSTLFINSERLKNTLKPAFQELQTKTEALISSGLIFDATYQLSIVAIPNVNTAKEMRNYRVFSQIEEAISQIGAINQAKINGTGPSTLRLEIQSSKSTSDLAAQLESARLPGFRLQRDRVDSSSLTMRYLK